VAGAKRQRELARKKHDRQQARRAAAARRARQRAQIAAATLAVVVVIGGVYALSRLLGDGSPAAAPTSSETAAATTPGTATAAAKPTGDCTYTRLDEGSGQQAKFVGLPGPKQSTSASYTAKIVTNRGTIELTLLADRAPCAVNSFRFLAGKGFYDNTKCHRMLVDTEGILQCGDPAGSGKGGPGYSFPDENLTGASYPRGTLAMANSGRDTNGSQFFLVFRASSFPPSYTPFGRITKGLDILDKVAKGGVRTTPQAAGNTPPKLDVVIQDVVVTEQK
jgi:peptidyl-prolyl cis-trans isomerase B (cyclophilin B)